jgi:hypothetical protein
LPDDWFSYRELAFQDPDCIIFIASHIAIFEDGRWPQPPNGRRMTDGPISLTPLPKDPPLSRHKTPYARNKEAPFVKPEGIAAEFRRRLELVRGSDRADGDRVLFEEHVMGGTEIHRLARIKACPEWLVDYRIRRVLRFLTGKGLKYLNGRPATYAEWIAKRVKERGHVASE